MIRWIPVALGLVLGAIWALAGLGIGQLFALVSSAALVLWAYDKLRRRCD